MQCVACGAPMIIVESQGVELDWCLECGGVWFDGDELECLLREAGLDVSLVNPHAAARGHASAGERPRRCPRFRSDARK